MRKYSGRVRPRERIAKRERRSGHTRGREISRMRLGDNDQRIYKRKETKEEIPRCIIAYLLKKKKVTIRLEQKISSCPEKTIARISFLEEMNASGIFRMSSAKVSVSTNHAIKRLPTGGKRSQVRFGARSHVWMWASISIKGTARFISARMHLHASFPLFSSVYRALFRHHLLPEEVLLYPYVCALETEISSCFIPKGPCRCFICYRW